MKNTEIMPRLYLFKMASLVGMLAGTGYALGTWGIEAVVLSRAHGMYPFLKFAVGLFACLGVGLLAGVLSRRFVNLFANILIWAGTGAILNRISLYLTFPFMKTMLEWLHSPVGAIVDYSVDYGVSTREALMLVITIVACGFIGLFANSIVDDASISDNLRRSLSLVIWGGIFIGIGYLNASLNTNPMRDAVVTVDRSIQFSIAHSGEDLSNEDKSQMGLFGLKEIDPYLNSPYRLILFSYDKMLMYIQVLVQFENQTAICPVINNRLGTCITAKK